jgi:hypothetical protein
VLFLHERASHCYRTSSCFLSKVLFDIIPLRVYCPLIYCIIVYAMCGLNAYQPNRALDWIIPYSMSWFVITIVLSSAVASSMCLFVGALVHSIR